MMIRRSILFAAAFFVGGAFIAPARAETLSADLANHLISITAGFQGANVLLFGATEGEGDVVVVVRGPERTIKVRRKDRIAGIWINADEIDFNNVPAFYQVASARPVGEFVPDDIIEGHQMNLDHLKLESARSGAISEKDAMAVDSFRRALIRGKTNLGLYAPENKKINFLGSRLFRADIEFPSNVPTGLYTIEAFLIRDGAIVGAQTTPLAVSKAGIGAAIFEFAHQHSALYGIFVVILAMSAGILSGIIFRRT